MASAAAPPRHRAPSSVRTAAPAVVTSAVVAAAALLGLPALVVVVVVVQVSAAAGVLLLADVPGRRESALLTGAAVVGADLLAVRRSGTRIGDLAAVVALAIIAAVLLELVRRDRERVTESLAATVTAAVLVVFGAHLLSLRGSAGGPRVVATALAAVAVGLLAGALVELVARGPIVASGSRRGVLGVVVSTGSAAAFGAIGGGALASVSGGQATVLALSSAAAAAVAGLVVELACADVGAARRRAAAGPLGAALPVVIAAPVAYAVSRLVIG